MKEFKDDDPAKRFAKFFNKHPLLKSSMEDVTSCMGCKHFFYHNDGSGGCDSPMEKVCLNNRFRDYKEFE